jgi:hypothetical protein
MGNLQKGQKYKQLNNERTWSARVTRAVLRILRKTCIGNMDEAHVPAEKVPVYNPSHLLSILFPASFLKKGFEHLR